MSFPPVDLEGVLLTHPNVIDAGVIGVWSEAKATEFPRAYVVPRGGAGSLKTSVEKDAFGREIQTWIRSKVARHKYLRGGEFDYVYSSASTCIYPYLANDPHRLQSTTRGLNAHGKSYPFRSHPRTKFPRNP
ncbi:hypothetical protein BU17DRAFT_100190 [Hysterangium stoloniferum]|nr:hypothetical protein BU17DRAFT_100190 [Hysterangium stoloniferum]